MSVTGYVSFISLILENSPGVDRIFPDQGVFPSFVLAFHGHIDMYV